MPAQSPSIQSFFKLEARSTQSSPTKTSTKLKRGDGFTPAEIKKEFHPMKTYVIANEINDLMPGMTDVVFQGRIANFNTTFGKSSRWSTAAGWHKLIVKDEMASVQVTLFFMHEPYILKLGAEIKIWASTITSESARDRLTVSSSRLATCIFPGKDPSVHVLLSTEQSDARLPKHQQKILLAGKKATPTAATKNMISQQLVTLKAFLAGADDVPDATLLYCVKSVAPAKTVVLKSGGEVTLREIRVFDETLEVVFKLWNELCSSADDWVAGQTILMVTNPALKKTVWTAQSTLQMGVASMIEIDPEHEDADWLRRYADCTLKGDSMCQDIPDKLAKGWDVEKIESRKERVLFTLAQVDDWAREDTSGKFSGFLNVIILGVDLASLRRLQRLLCNECCSLPIYSNETSQTCKNCSKSVNLTLNPKIIGTLVDETGSIPPGRLIWTRRAWEMLFGRPIAELLRMSAQDLKELEVSMLFMRITLIFGWSGQLGKLAILGVRE